MTISHAEPAVAPEQLERPRRAHSTVTLLVLLGVVAASVLVAVGLGPTTIHPADTAGYLWAGIAGGTVDASDAATYQIVWQVRTPRVLLAAVVGAGLTAVGVAVQAMVRNPLADPFVLGVSSGAAVGAVAVSTVGALAVLGIHAVSVGAFVGALLAGAMVYAAARGGTGVTALRLVLIGVAMSFAFQAVMSVIIYLAPDSEATSTVLFWTMGSFGAATWSTMPVVAITVLAGAVVVQRIGRRLDVLALGDETAAGLGVDADRLRRRLFALTSVMTGAMVAVSGAIGFVGLVMPHVVRILVGAAHARVLLVAPLLGAAFMVWVDLVSRTLVAPRELPLGVVTALVGVPVFITLIRRRSYLFGSR